MFYLLLIFSSIWDGVIAENSLCQGNGGDGTECKECVLNAEHEEDGNSCKCNPGYVTYENLSSCQSCYPYCKKCDPFTLNKCIECYDVSTLDNSCRCEKGKIFLPQLQKCVSDDDLIDQMKDQYSELQFNFCAPKSDLNISKLNDIFNTNQINFTQLNKYSSIGEVKNQITIKKQLLDKENHKLLYNFDQNEFNISIVKGKNNSDTIIVYEVKNLQNEKTFLLTLKCQKESYNQLNKEEMEKVLHQYFHLFQPCPLNCQSCLFSNTAVTCQKCSNGFQLVNNSCLFQQYPTNITNFGNPSCLQNCKTCNDEENECMNCIDGYKVEEIEAKKVCVTQQKQCFNNENNENCLQVINNKFLICKKNDTCVDCLNSKEIDQSNLNKAECTCEDGYYFEIKAFNCEKCDDSCKTCVDKKKQCLSCMQGKFIENQKCIPCSENCSSCTSLNVCTQCKVGYYNKNKQTCVKCGDHCKKCENDKICTLAEEGYFIGDKSQIQKCKDSLQNCVICEDKETCTNCDSEYYLTKENKCGKCEIGCKTCTQNQSNSIVCNSCIHGYYLDDINQLCKACIQNCIQCIDETQCNACKDGFDYVEEQNKCQCKKGYFDESTNKCQNCMEGCKKCQDKDTCETCDDLYPINKENQCVKIKCKQNCKTCKKENECDTCLDGFIFDKKLKICTCPANCKKCKETKDKKQECDACNEGYYVENKQCKTCPQYCKECDAKKCKSCLSKYILNDGRCYEDKCEAYDEKTKKCTECQEQYYLKDQVCLPCSNKNNCFKCSGEGECTDCDNQYYLAGDICKHCGENCQKCNSEDCEECRDGFELNSGICMKQNNFVTFFGLLFTAVLLYGIYNFREQLQQLCIGKQNKIELPSEGDGGEGDVELPKQQKKGKSARKSDFDILNDD